VGERERERERERKIKRYSFAEWKSVLGDAKRAQRAHPFTGGCGSGGWPTERHARVGAEPGGDAEPAGAAERGAAAAHGGGSPPTLFNSRTRLNPLLNCRYLIETLLTPYWICMAGGQGGPARPGCARVRRRRARVAQWLTARALREKSSVAAPPWTVVLAAQRVYTDMLHSRWGRRLVHVVNSTAAAH
jgi:hypothetical protein